MDTIQPLLKDKITLLSGNSGVGKSTFINHILPGANLRTSEISDAHNTGMHTTTFSEMLQLPEGGWIIDTPGIKGFGTFDIEPEELTSYFKDIFHFSKECRCSRPWKNITSPPHAIRAISLCLKIRTRTSTGRRIDEF